MEHRPQPRRHRFEAQSFLTGVTALASNNVYAVGGILSLGSPSGTLSEHWNGTAWSVVSTPAGAGTLSAVAGLASGPLFAAGFQASGAERTLILQH